MPPELCGRGVRPNQAANWRPDRKIDASGTVAAMAEAAIGPMPGTVAMRCLTSSWRGAGFHANQTLRYLREELENLSQAELAPNNGVALRINGVDLKHVLGQIKADNDNLLRHGTTPLDVASDSRILHTNLGAGAVHPITSKAQPH